MGKITHTKKLISNNRCNIRKEVVNWFLEEPPGTGKGNECSKNTYVVETYKDLTITLERPANLNKGFDFIVNVNGMYFMSTRRHRNPSHPDIIDALKQVYNSDHDLYNKKIKPLIQNIYDCKNVLFDDNSIACFLDYEEKQRPIEIILLSIKWLFIEQDITYWNWSGRKMLYEGLKEENLI